VQTTCRCRWADSRQIRRHSEVAVGLEGCPYVHRRADQRDADDGGFYVGGKITMPAFCRLPHTILSMSASASVPPTMCDGM
jgi:hypothetical protein